MTDLIARLEAAEAGSRELDSRIVYALDLAPHGFWRIPGVEHGTWAAAGNTTWVAPHYSTSLDAAMALAERVLPGWEGEIDFGRRGFACLHPEQPYPAHLEYNAEASTPALALCAAILRASEQERGE